MKIRIRHCTEYQFSRAVYIEPHLLRMQPRPGPGYRVEHHHLRVSPGDAQVRDLLEFDGGRAVLLTCALPTAHLRIEAESLVSFQEHNPFDFILYPTAGATVAGLADLTNAPQFAPYRLRDTASAEVEAYAWAAVNDAKGDTVSFLTVLSETMCRDFDYNVRETGRAYGPDETLAARAGACRDFAVLYIDVCRVVGVPARFVSGYLGAVEEDSDVQHLHAWVEVYLPGAGWRGFDPTHGIAATNRYIATAAARSPDDAAPVSGTFRGTDATAELTTRLEIVEMR